jgi:hypothetical protein
VTLDDMRGKEKKKRVEKKKKKYFKEDICGGGCNQNTLHVGDGIISIR